MPSIPHVLRRGAVYYWRRRVPAAFANCQESAILILGLRTSDARRARFLGGQVTALADLFLRDPMHERLPFDVLQTVFRKVFTEHLDKLDLVVTRERMEPDFDHEASRRVEVVMGWVYRLLEIRGLSASVDNNAATMMREAGLDERGIAEVGHMLDLMRRQGVAAEPPARLKGMVEHAGGIPNPMNMGLVQTAIFRGRSAALFETQRRHAGIRIEDADNVTGILKQRAADALKARLIERDSSEPAHSAPRDGGAATAPSGTADKPTAATATASPEAPSPARKQAPAIELAQHPIIVLGEKLIEKNVKSKAWDEKTQKQARQIYALFAKLLLERGVIEFGDLHQGEFAALDDLLASISKSYGKSSADATRTMAELRAIGAAKSPSERVSSRRP